MSIFGRKTPFSDISHNNELEKALISEFGFVVSNETVQKVIHQSIVQQNPDAMEDLATFYDYPRADEELGMPYNPERAMYWWKKAVDLSNSANAHYHYARHLNWINQEQMDPSLETEALNHFMAAAEQGHAGAFYMLGSAYSIGTVLKQDYAMAFSCFKKAAERGDYESMIKLFEYYRDGIGTDQNLELALYWGNRAKEYAN